MTGPGATYADQVHAWAEELRRGSTRTWRDHRAANGEVPPAPADAPTPGAAQLEVVRRLAKRAAVIDDFAGLADLVLATPGPGRGRLDVPLPWDEAPAYGSPPVQPETLSPDELLRVCAGGITALLPGLPPPRPERVGRRIALRRRFVVLGAPSSARILAAELRRQGFREGGPKPTYLVLAGPLEQVMAQRWAARVRAGSTIRWRRFWRYSHAHDRVPPGIQAPAIATRLAEQFGGGRVHLVVARDTATAMKEAAGVLGAKVVEVDEPAELYATDLLRVVNAPLTLAVGPEERQRLVDTVWPGLVDEQPRPIGVPVEHAEWAHEMATRQVERIVSGARTAGYAVHGDPTIVVPDPQAGADRAIRRRTTLDLGLEVLGRAWSEQERVDEGEDRG